MFDPGEPAYALTLASQFNLLTPENSMMMSSLEPAQGVFNFTNADAIVQFAAQNGMKVRGHPLIWGSYNPAWLTNPSTPFSVAQLTSLMQTYITTVVSHYHTTYPGTVIQWVVVNEALSNSAPYGLAPSVWSAIPNYVNLAFQFAHAADPTAQLYYNDYSIEITAPGTKGAAAMAFAQGLKAAGVPINGVGFEAHVGLNSTPGGSQNIQNPATQAQITSALTQYSSAGLNVAITEFDMSLNPPASPTVTQLSAQTTAYQDYLTACTQAANCTAFSTWGVTDKYSWIPATFSGYGSPLIFDSSYNPKSTIYPLLQTILSN